MYISPHFSPAPASRLAARPVAGSRHRCVPCVFATRSRQLNFPAAPACALRCAGWQLPPPLPRPHMSSTPLSCIPRVVHPAPCGGRLRRPRCPACPPPPFAPDALPSFEAMHPTPSELPCPETTQSLPIAQQHATRPAVVSCGRSDFMLRAPRSSISYTPERTTPHPNALMKNKRP